MSSLHHTWMCDGFAPLAGTFFSTLILLKFTLLPMLLTLGLMANLQLPASVASMLALYSPTVPFPYGDTLLEDLGNSLHLRSSGTYPTK